MNSMLDILKGATNKRGYNTTKATNMDLKWRLQLKKLCMTLGVPFVSLKT